MSALERRKRQSAVLLACVVGLSVGLPQVFLATFSQFFGPLEAEFGWSRVQLSGVFSIVTLCIAFATPVFTVLINKLGPSPVLVVSNIALAALMALLALTSHTFSMFVFWTIAIGLVGTGTTTFVYLGTLPQWFDRRLGLALGIAAIGIGAGQAALPILAQHVIENHNWRIAYLCLSVLVVVLALPGALGVIRGIPNSVNGVSRPNARSLSEAAALVARQAWSRGEFWLLTLSYFFLATVAAGCAVHAMPILVERGIPANEAVRIVALGGLSVLVSRVAAGYFLDVIGPRVVALIACVAAILAPVLLATWSSSSLVLLAPILYGLAMGIEGDLMPYSVRRVFGNTGHAILYGRMFSVFNLGVVAGPILMGLAYDLTGTYDFVLIVFSILGALTVPLLLCGLKATAPLGRPGDDDGSVEKR